MVKVWRERVAYAAMSLFVAWHTLAMIVAPAPDTSVLIRGLRVVFEPYLDFFGLDNEWNFFAPGVNNDPVFRYAIKDAAGADHSFDPTADLNWLHPSYIWFRAWYLALLANSDDLGDEFAALFCRQHAELHPVVITLLSAEQQDYGPQDRLRGKQPMDPEFLKTTKVKSFECPR